MGRDDEIDKRRWREIFSEDKVWKTQEYFVYFKFFKQQYSEKRSVSSRRRFQHP